MKVRLTGILALALLLTSAVAAFATPNVVTYQGRLTDAAGNPSNGTFSMVFAIYAASSGGSALYTETQPSVTVTNGLFNVQIGSVTTIPGDLFAGGTKFLGIKVGADAEMTPRQAVASVPFAIHSTFAQGMPFCVVRGTDGAILRQSGGFSCTRNSAGSYVVDTAFNESQTGFMICSFNSPGAGITPCLSTCFANDASGFQIRTSDTAGTLIDHDFSLIIPVTTGLPTSPQSLQSPQPTAQLVRVDPKTNLPIQ